MRIFKGILLVTLFLAVSCKSKHTDLSDGLYADIETVKGTILVELYYEDTPLAVSSFVSLSEGTNPNVVDSLKGKKYFEGLKFHRVMKNFIIQGGDPKGTGRGGPGYLFESEYPKDSLGNLLYKHDGAGVLSMANYGQGTSGSQFFITHTKTPWLDGVHTVFGHVKVGQSVVDSIAKDDLIKHITLIRVGSKAKAYDAAKTFVEEFKKNPDLKAKRLEEERAKEKIKQEKILAQQKVFYEKMGVAKAKKTASGLQILTLKRGRGKRFNKAISASMHYTISLATGKSIQSTVGKDPFAFTMSEQPMISGVTEAILKMRQGGKVRLFIPYYLAYGEKGGGPFPPKADVVFELELVKVGK